MANEKPVKNATNKLDAKTRIFRSWRGLNTSILLIAFFAPWYLLAGCLSGPEGEIYVYSGYDVAVETLTSLPEISVWPWVIGIVSFNIYAVLNLVRAVTKDRPQNQAWLNVSLGGSVAFLVFVWIVPIWEEILWGYWLAWGGALSSILLELAERFSKRDYKPEENPP